MKRSLVLFMLSVVFLVLMPSELVSAASVKIGIIDTQRIMRESKAAQNARKIFLKDLDAKRAVLSAKQTEVRVMQEDLKREGPKMSASVRKEKAEKLQQELKELRRLRADLEEELKRKDVELTRKLLQEIKDIVEDCRKNKKYTIILEKNSVIAADEAIDITDEIIRVYDILKK